MPVITGPKGLVEAACWYAKHLGIDNVEFTLHIERRKLDAFTRALTFFDPEDMSGTIQLEPRNGSVDIYQSLAHEMVHVKQYVLGELDDIDISQVKWKGELYQSGDTEDEAYWNSPWEIEAYGREKGMNYLRMKANFSAK